MADYHGIVKLGHHKDKKGFYYYINSSSVGSFYAPDLPEHYQVIGNNIKFNLKKMENTTSIPYPHYSISGVERKY